MLANAGTLGLIPLPRLVQQNEGEFRIRPDIRVVADPDARNSAEYLAARLRSATGYPVPVANVIPTETNRDDICLTARSFKTGLGREGYELTVTSGEISISAADSSGAFYGVQTLLQLLPPEIFAIGQSGRVSWAIPAMHIEDQPRFKWRGFMLDVSRHFYNKAEVKQVLDFMAWHKLNVFHWHLVDDNGWRIEIKKYPRLTQVGAWRKNIGFELDPGESAAYGADGHYGGFYTQNDIREIVAYARDRHITIVPEIEMPGHSVAALAAYPELSCTGGPFNMDLEAGIFDGVYCAGNEETFKFLENVLTEIFQLFPGEYIHIGGDEVPKDSWKHCQKCQTRIKTEGLKNEQGLQSYFIRRIGEFVSAHGHKLVGWSEILQGGLAPKSTVMDWIGGGTEAANSGHDVVMSPEEYCYLCYYQSLDRPPKLKAARRYLPLNKVYMFDPVPAGLKPGSESHILGVEGCLWTVFFASMHELEEMSFPRLCALAEVAWSPKSSRNWDGFLQRLKVHQLRLDQAGVAYWKENSLEIGDWQPASVNSLTHARGRSLDNVLEWELPTSIRAAGQYRLSLNYTGGKHGLSIRSAALLENGNEIDRDTHEGLAGAGYNKAVKAHDWNYFLNLPTVKPSARYSVRVFVSGEDGIDSTGVVFIEPLPAKATK